ncbi:PhzF family phenazine biosynthesis protein [Mycoplasmatota bacterium]|nr:PhzF family phenazine biosynthesis protein [Mycoplasmatota bacterium]
MEKLFKLKAFPKTKNGGNKAGVYIFADDLTKSQMQKIAKEVGYSETAFVMKSDKADYKVRFFTPKFEVDICGHATIATFNLLRDLQIIDTGIYTQETKAGVLKLNVTDHFVFMEQPSPVFSDVIPKEELLACFKDIEFDQHLLPQILSTGLREIFLPLKSKSTLENIKPIHKKIIDLSRKYQVIGIHAFALAEDVDAYGRNFAPLIGINEESATGTSNGALGCYLHKHHLQKKQYILRQGYQMNQPSEIITKIDSLNDEISQVWVGGSAITIKK